MSFQKILIVGAGNMCGAMLDGWLAGGLEPSRFTILSPNRSDAPQGIEILRDAPAGGFDAIVLGFKPYMLAEIAPSLRSVASGQTVISVLAGVELADLAEHFPESAARVRLMSNLACALGKSPLPVMANGNNVDVAMGELLEPLGQADWILDESLFDLMTAFVGSGPAFLYRFVDALARGAVELGLDPMQAERLATSMVEGAAALAAASEHSPGELARRVASPGGVTQAGLDVLDNEEILTKLLLQTLQSACDRSVEMTEETKKNR